MGNYNWSMPHYFTFYVSLFITYLSLATSIENPTSSFCKAVRFWEGVIAQWFMHSTNCETVQVTRQTVHKFTTTGRDTQTFMRVIKAAVYDPIVLLQFSVRDCFFLVWPEGVDGAHTRWVSTRVSRSLEQDSSSESSLDPGPPGRTLASDKLILFRLSFSWSPFVVVLRIDSLESPRR